MATQVQIRRGTNTQNASFTGAEGELSVNTTNDSVHVHDGSTAGGFELARADFGNVSTMDGVVIGGTTPAAGSFTTLQASTSLNVDGSVTTDVSEGAANSLNTQISMKHQSGSTSYHLKTIRSASNDEPDGLAFVENTSERMRIRGENVGIGTSNIKEKLSVSGAAVFDGNHATGTNAYGAAQGVMIHAASSSGFITAVSNGANDVDLQLRALNGGAANSNQLVLDSEGGVGIGTSSPSHDLDVLSTTSGTSRTIRVASTASSGDNDATMIISNGGSGDAMLRFDYEGTNTDRARIGVSSSAQQLEFYTAGDNERMRIDSSGNVLVGTTDTTLFNNTSGGGINLMAANRLDVAREGDVVATFNRMTDDGSIIQFYAQGALEGSIDVSGNTVSLVGFSGAHASSGIDVTTAKGTVVSTVDQEHKNNHAKIKVSDSEGDARVYGVIDRISEEGDIIVSGIGIGEVKVTGACAGGDLLESNGDGTAKVQADDIITSKTIGNGEEGVKLVSCVLYCG